MAIGALNKYSKATVYINSQLLSQETSVTVDRNPGNLIVKTVELGFAGVAQGSSMMEVSISNAVPSAAFEFDPGAFMLQGKPVEITIYAAGKTLNSKGFIMSDNFSHSVDAESKLEFKATCRYAEWK